eukprot:TRINITY_DN74427_c0_g1_i1.p1 TRINITY_DN74427_c0_g1~~TRINITY_DN74427_c0_g1_i1.p1  ORF type:complete len:528 (+),score=74.33 TRINITY_DN74427_c0_g1_i1:205-1584(+)
MSTANVYTGNYKLESNGSILQEGRLRMLMGNQPTSLMSVHLNAASISLVPQESRRSYHNLQPDIFLSGVELEATGRLIATGTTDPRNFHSFGNRACSLSASLDVRQAGEDPKAFIKHNHLGGRVSVPDISGQVRAAECGFSLRFESALVNTALLSQKVVHYSVWVNLLCLFQISCFLSQMKEDGPEVSKVSMACIGLQALTDAFDSFLHVALGMSSQYMFNSLAVIAFFKFILFSFLEARYLLIILRHRRHDQFAQGWEVVRREVSQLYTQFYGALLIGMMIIYQSLNHLDLIVMLLQAYWVPQILRDAWYGCRSSLKTSFISGISISRLLLPLYLWGCPYSIFRGDIYPRLPGAPSSQWCLFLLVAQATQVGVLLLQRRYGPRFFVPWVCMPWAYNYRRFIAIDPGTECVICMVELSPEDGARVVTPCNHAFHKTCLEQWMEVKMECPTCRTELPPIM